MTRPTRLLPSILALAMLLGTLSFVATAESPANQHFQRTWERTDQPVATLAVSRTWMWGPQANTGALQEKYVEAPSELRTVQYFDKSRMEITNPDGDPATPWYVTNGLLVIELMSGRLQLGDDTFEQHAPAVVNVAGDADDPTGPTYATFAALRAQPPAADGALLTQRVSRDGGIVSDAALAGQGVRAAHRVQVPGIDHQVAGPFWTFMNSTGLVRQGGQLVTASLFENPFYATGYPITEAYWANVKVGGVYRDVLMQCFERRCLTYTPGNPAGFVVEAGNVGQHYYTWRYEQIVGTPTPTTTATASPTPTEIPVSTDYRFSRQWGSPLAGVDPLRQPLGVDVDAAGNIFVADGDNHRIVQFDAHGRLVRTIQTAAQPLSVGVAADPAMVRPIDVATDDAGHVYAVDSTNRVHVFELPGIYRFSFGSEGDGEGQFRMPTAIEVAGGRVYVADGQHNRVEVFDLDGTFLFGFGSTGSGNGQFGFLTGIAIDRDGNLLALDGSNDHPRVQRLTVAGIYVDQFGDKGTEPGKLSGPFGVAAGADGSIYVAHAGDLRVQRFDAGGGFVEGWGSFGIEYGQLNGASDLAVAPNGDVVVADSGNDRLQVFGPSGTWRYAIRDARRGEIDTPGFMALDLAGNLLVVDRAPDGSSVTRYAPDGVPLDDLGTVDPKNPLLQQALGVVVTGSGAIYVSDDAANRVVRFSAAWQPLGQWGVFGTGPGFFNRPGALALDAAGNVYVVDAGNNRVQKYTTLGVFLTQWDGLGAGTGQLNEPRGIAVQGDRVYVVDGKNNRVQVYDLNGVYQRQIGSAGSGDGQLKEPSGIAVRADGYVFVADTGNQRVQLFDATGAWVASLGVSGPGELDEPGALAIDAEGTLYVADAGTNRIIVYTPVE